MAKFSGTWSQRQQGQSLGAGTWPTAGVYADLLVVAGGGSAAYSDDGTYKRFANGSGGAGGYIAKNLLLAQGSTYSITVGAGGTRPASAGVSYQGSNSVISGNSVYLTAYGGGGGGGDTTSSAPSYMNGGSGGGGGNNTSLLNRGNGIYGQGFPGGKGGAFYGSGGAGGGAGGYAATTTFGPGVANSITGSSVTYARGGKQIAEAGVANSGNGGNTDGWNYSNTNAGDSGVVIIRYADSYPAATTTGSPSVTVSGGYRIYVYTGAGTFTL